MMQQGPNRLGLGLRAPPPPYAIQSVPAAPPAPMEKLTTLFVGSISPGIDNTFLESLFSSCGPLRSFKRLLTAAGKPQAFAFAEYEEPDAVSRALETLNGLRLPNLEDRGGEAKTLLVKADEKTRAYLDAYEAQRIKTDQDEEALASARASISHLLATIGDPGANGSAANSKKDLVIPPHLRDLQEADLPEEQRGLVMSEIALFRERAAKRESEKKKAAEEAANQSASLANYANQSQSPVGPPTGPGRGWGRGAPPTGPQQGYGQGAQGYNRPVGFVKAGDRGHDRGWGRRGSRAGEDGDYRDGPDMERSDWDIEREKQEMRRQQEENSFRDRERRYEARERQRVTQIERQIARDRAILHTHDKERAEMAVRLQLWDDDESDELFYTDRARWRANRNGFLAREKAADDRSRELEQREADHLQEESEKFLERQMEELASLADEQRKAGLLMDDNPIRLSIAANVPKVEAKAEVKQEPRKVVMEEEEDEDAGRKKRGLVKLDFDAMGRGGKRLEKLETIKGKVLAMEVDAVLKHKLNWLALSDATVDAKVEPWTRKKMTSYLGELDDDEMVMFVVEHVKDHKPAPALVEGLEPVLEEEANEFVHDLWRQLLFESLSYSDGVDTADMYIV